MSAAENLVPSPFDPEPPVEEWADLAEREAEVLTGAALDARIDWLMERMRENREQARANADVADRRMDMIRRWRDGENASLDRQYAYLESLVLQHAAGYDYGTKKSRTLPNGKFGRRISQRAGIKVVDEGVALEWARQHNPDAVKVTEKLLVTPLKEWAASTGLCPSGCEPVAEVESVFVEVR